MQICSPLTSFRNLPDSDPRPTSSVGPSAISSRTSHGEIKRFGIGMCGWKMCCQADGRWTRRGAHPWRADSLIEVCTVAVSRRERSVQVAGAAVRIFRFTAGRSETGAGLITVGRCRAPGGARGD